VPRPSSIDRLPPELREAIRALRERGRTIDEILGHLQGMEAEVSRSALGRHVQKLDRIGERLRRSRLISETLRPQLGDAPESDLARYNIEVLQSFIFELLELGADPEAEGAEDAAKLLKNPKALETLSQSLANLTRASRTNVDFLAKVEERAAAKARAAAATAAERTAKERGLSGETIAAIQRSILGLKDAA
jgi:hypothetical protein